MNITYFCEKQHHITEAEFRLILDMRDKDEKIKVIKFIRNQYPELGLYEAKQLCDTVLLNQTTPYNQ